MVQGRFKHSIIIFLLGIGFFAVKPLQAQDPQFGHFYSNSMLYNPAFTGNVDLGRFALSYRNQWPSIPGNYISYAASYDHYFSEIKSGVGLQFVNDRAGSGGLTNRSINFMYSYQIRLNRELSLMAGIKGGYHFRFYDFSKFTFADQIARDDAPESIVNGFRDRINFPNFGNGLVFYHQEDYWLGVSFDHLNQPTNGFVDEESSLDIRTAIQAGYNFKVNKGYGGRAGGKVTAAALYKSQREWDQLDLGLYYRTEPYLFGIWYRGLPLKSNESDIPNVDAIMLLAGFKADRITFAYSYDVTISRLAGSTGGSHELSLILEYPKAKRRNKRFFRVPCPKF
ncbi:MAG: PorP/SprF family type IX secretion system membrane protein [Vicingaceae bacterium]